MASRSYHADGPDCNELDAEFAESQHTRGEPGPANRYWPDARDMVTMDDMLWASMKIDSAGRRWRVADVDYLELQERADEYVDEVFLATGVEVARVDVVEALSGEAPDPEMGAGADQTWTTVTTCDSDSDVDAQFFDGEDRQEIAPAGFDSFASHGTATIYRQDGGRCSASFIDSNSVLTAGHCVYDGGPVDESDLKVCNFGNYGFMDANNDNINGVSEPNSQCFSVSDVNIAPNVLGIFGWGGDYAVLNLTRSALPDYEDQPFYLLDTTTGTSFISLGSEVRKYGGPGFVDSPAGGSLCNSNNVSSGGVNTVFGGTSFLPLWWGAGDVDFLTAAVVGTQIDGGDGDSGAGYYKWNGSGFPIVVGVHKGWNGTDTYSGGPRVSNIFTWIQAND